jgi:hypothetical protein
MIAHHIAFALRDLLEENLDWENPFFQEFRKGYTYETELDQTLLKEKSWFIRMHKIVSFTKLLRSVDILESPNNPDWLNILIGKLSKKIDSYRSSLENNEC